jgi:hypothetical protein
MWKTVVGVVGDVRPRAVLRIRPRPTSTFR